MGLKLKTAGVLHVYSDSIILIILFFFGGGAFRPLRPFRTTHVHPSLSVLCYFPPVCSWVYCFNVSLHTIHLRRRLPSGLFPIGSSSIAHFIIVSSFLQTRPAHIKLLFAASIDMHSFRSMF